MSVPVNIVLFGQRRPFSIPGFAGTMSRKAAENLAAEPGVDWVTGNHAGTA